MFVFLKMRKIHQNKYYVNDFSIRIGDCKEEIFKRTGGK